MRASMRRLRLFRVGFIAICGMVAGAQDFDVASVKGNEAGSGSSGSQIQHGRITGTNLSLNRYIRMAYDVNEFQVVGPDWLDSDRFDIQAKAPEGTSEDAFRVMLQRLLADRFRMQTHFEMR